MSDTNSTHPAGTPAGVSQPTVAVAVPAAIADAVRAVVKHYGELRAERVAGNVTAEVHVRGDGATAFNTTTKRVSG